MQKLTVQSESCSIWNDGQLEKTGSYDLGCSACSSFSSFLIVKTSFVWRWEIDIPPDWKFGDWSRIHLYLVQVAVYIVQCGLCKTKYRIYPSFAAAGTILNISALIFIAFVYEYSNLTWRDLPKYFCRGYDTVAHSTLFKAVHGLASALLEYCGSIQEGIKELAARYLPDGKDETTSGWPDLKSIYPHTIKREGAIRDFLSSLLSFETDIRDFFHLFHTYLKRTRILMSNVDPPVKTLYF